jgi:large subunit ribosomal protein L21
VYAVIRTGGKQYKVRVGDVIDVEHVAGDDGGSVELVPLLVVDDDGKVSSRPSELAGAKVTASVVGHHRGEKVRVFGYKNKTGQRHHQGHRQSLTTIKVEGIDPPGKAKAAAKAKTARPAKDKDAEAKAKPARAAEEEGAATAGAGAKAESGTKAEAGAKGQSGAKAKPAATKAKTSRASAGTKEADTKDAKPAARSRTRAKQDEEN